MAYKLVKQIRDNETLRKSFNELALQTFEIDFEDWYQGGFWSDKYLPYCFVDGDKVVASAAVNLIDFSFEGQVRPYLQIGTVMTAENYRHQGLARQLIEEILKDYQSVAGIYLFANQSVLDFYPKFGFEPMTQYQLNVPVKPAIGDFEKMDMDSVDNQRLLINLYQKSNPFSRFSFHNNSDLLMFYGANFMKDCVYYSKKRNLAVVAIQNATTLECFDIYGETDTQLTEILNEVVSADTTSVNLGFSAPMSASMTQSPVRSDETLFIYQNKENLFADKQLMFPLLSHA